MSLLSKFFHIHKEKNSNVVNINDYIQYLLQLTHNSFKRLDAKTIHNQINTDDYFQWTVNNLGNSIANIYLGKLDQLWAVQKKYMEDKIQTKDIIAGVHLEQCLTLDKLKFGIHFSVPTLVDIKPAYRVDLNSSHILLILGYDEHKDIFLLGNPFDEQIETKMIKISKDKNGQIIMQAKQLGEIISNIALSIRLY